MCLPVQPFKIEREWKHAGLSCAVTLTDLFAHRCGYVRVPPGHPLHGISGWDLDVTSTLSINFAKLEPCSEHEDGQGWWFGFDCAQGGAAFFDPKADLSLVEDPVMAEHIKRMIHMQGDLASLHLLCFEDHYWTEDDVVREVESLADQIARIEVCP